MKNTAFEVNEPVYETTEDIIAGATYVEIYSQHDKTHGNENYAEIDLQHETHSNEEYVEIHSQKDAAQENEEYEMVAIAISTETRIETHSNEAYQTNATAISNVAYGSQMGNEDDYEENAAYDGRVDDRDDYEEYAEPRYQ